MLNTRANTEASAMRQHFDIEYRQTELKGRAVRGGAVSIAGQGARFIIQTGSTMILARLLVPSDFGLIAMVTAVTGFATLFKDLGLSMATVQKDQINHEQISKLFWVNVAVSLLIASAIAGIAPIIAWFYNEPRLLMITITMAPVFLLGGLTVQHQAPLQRQMRFMALAMIQVVSMAFGVGVAIAFSFFGAGYWALVMMHLASALAIAAGVWLLCDWRPGGFGRKSEIKSMLTFGANLTGFNILNYFSRNLDNVLIGKAWGPVSLGYYSKAYALLMLPISQITAPIAHVAIPVLSRLQKEPDEYARYFYRAINVIAFITMPMIMFLAAFSQEIILIVLGGQWTDAAPIFKVLAFAALLQPVTNPTGWVYISLGQTNRMLRWALFAAPVTILSFFIGLPWGAIGVAAAYTVTSLTALTFPNLWWAFRSSPLTIYGWVKSVQCPFVGSCGVYLIVETVRHVASPHFSNWISLVLSGGAALLFFVLLMAIWKRGRKEIREGWNLLRHLRPNAAC
jgi:O-antigen/teichoic acid export membrane protein